MYLRCMAEKEQGKLNVELPEDVATGRTRIWQSSRTVRAEL